MEKEEKKKRRRGEIRALRKRSRYLAHLAAVARTATTAVGAGKAAGNSRKAATTQLI